MLFWLSKNIKLTASYFSNIRKNNLFFVSKNQSEKDVSIDDFGMIWRSLLILLIIYIGSSSNVAGFFRNMATALEGNPEKQMNYYLANCSTFDDNNTAWAGAANIAGAPTVTANNPDYSADNSAIYRGGVGEVVCQGFGRGNKTAHLLEIKATSTDSEQSDSASTTADTQIKTEPFAEGNNFEQGTTSPATTTETASATSAMLDLSSDGRVSPAVDASVTEATSVAPTIIEQSLGAISDLGATVLTQVSSLLNVVDLTSQALDFVKEKVIEPLSTVKQDAQAETADETTDDVGQIQSVRLKLSLTEINKAVSSSTEAEASTSATAAAPSVSSSTEGKITIWYSLPASTSEASSTGELWQSLASLTLGSSTDCANVESTYACLKESFSEELNGGYLSFILPFIQSKSDIKNLRLKVSGQAQNDTPYEFYLDSMWLTVNYQTDDTDNGYEQADKIIYNGQEINFVYTDDNTNENLIIKSDKVSYDGVSGNDVYFSVTNTGTTEENVDLQVHFPVDVGQVAKIERLRVKEKRWEENAIVDGAVPNPYFFQKAFYSDYHRKNIPTSLRAKQSTKDTTRLAPGKTQYFKMTMSYPVGSNGEFYIEALGDNQGYGLLDPWWTSSWHYKLPINVFNPSTSVTLTDYQVLVELASTTVPFWQHVKSDGSDIRFVDSTETTPLSFWTQYFIRSASSTKIWVKVPSLAPNSTTTVYLYYGNPVAASSSDMYSTFTYSTMQDLFYVVSSSTPTATVTVVSLIDNNQVQLDGQAPVNLNRQQVATMTSAIATSVLRAKGPVMARVTGRQGSDALVPISFASQQTVIPSSVGVMESYYVYAPFAKANTTFFNGITLNNTKVLATSTATTSSYNVAASSSIIEATSPVLVAFNDNTGNGLIQYPATNRDLYGIRSNNNNIGIAATSSFQLYCSVTATLAVAALNRGVQYANVRCGNGANGTGEAVRIGSITGKIGAIQQNDTDGFESTTFLPDIELSSEYMLPTDTSYVAIACAANTGPVSLAVYDQNNVFVSTTTCNSTAANPGKAFFGTTSTATMFMAGSRIVSTNASNTPFYAYYEDMTASSTGGGAESNLWGAVQSRKNAYQIPVVSFGVEDSYKINVTGKVYSDEGVTPLLSKPIVTLIFNGSIMGTTTASAVDGSYAFSNVVAPFSGSSTLVFLASTTVSGASYNRYLGINDITNYDIYQNRIIARHDDAGPLTNTDINRYDADQNTQIKAKVTGTAFLASSTQSLYIWPSDTFAPGGTITMQTGGSGSSTPSGDIDIASSTSVLNVGVNAVSLSGDWLNYGSFIYSGAQTTTFTATGTGFTINNNGSNFYNVTLNGAAGGWRVASSTTINNNLTLTAGTLSGTSSVTVKGGTVSGNGLINMTGGDFTVVGTGNFGGTSGWIFNNLIFGNGSTIGTTTKASSGAATSTGSIIVNTNQVFIAGTSIWYLAGTGTPFIINGVFQPLTSTFVYNGVGTTTIAAANYSVLTLTPRAVGNPTYNWASGTTTIAGNCTIGNGVIPVTVTASATNAVIDATGNFTVSAAATFVAATSSPLYLAGNWSSVGTFVENGGQIVFDAIATGRTIGAGNSNFHDVYFNSPTGGWTMGANATATGNWVLNAGTFSAAARTLVVKGNFINNLVNASTTWTTSILYLNGTSQTINASTSLGDDYATLRVGSTTQIAMWNSTSSIYTIDPGGSLYSMDHFRVNGALYIWGNYRKTSGNDYWSYATDFDGTNISGAPRQVNVRIAPNSTTTYTGGTLNVIGQNMTTGSTSIASQAAGNYNMYISNGTINATNFNIANIATSGLTIIGSSTVGLLSNGGFNLWVATGTMMTVSSTTIDNNPQENLPGLVFATTTGIRFGYNVSVLGTSTSFWYLPGATGNWAGESRDNDGAGTCGAILWSDSACVTTVDQTHFRWRLDDGAENTASWSVNEDTLLTNQLKNQNLRLRLSLDNTGANVAWNYNYRLQMAAKGAFATCAVVPAGNFTDMATTTTGNPSAVMTDSTFVVNQTTSTPQMTSLGSFSYGRFVASNTNQTLGLSMGSTQYTEAEYNFNFTNTALNNETYCFRAVNASTSLATYTRVAGVKIVGINVGGNAYEDEATTPWSGCDNSTDNISLVVNGALVASTTCSSADGAYNFSNVDVVANAPVSVFFNGVGANTDKGVVVTKAANGYTDILVNPRKSRVSLEMETGITSITNSDLTPCYNGSSTACTNVPYVMSANNLTVEASAKLIVTSNTTYQPGGNVTLAPGSLAAGSGGDLLISSSAILNIGANAMSVGGDWLNLGTFTELAGQTVTLTATSTGFTLDNNNQNFTNLNFAGVSGGWSFSASTTIDGNLTVSAGTLSGTNNLTVNGGNATGDGLINLTGGSFNLAGTGSFGGNTNWSFNNLQIGMGTLATTTKNGLSTTTVVGLLTVATSTTLNASTSTWILTSGGTPLVVLGSLNFASSTFKFLATSPTTVSALNYYRLELTPNGAGSPTYTLAPGLLKTTDYMLLGDSNNSVTINAALNNTQVDVGGDFLIKNGATYTASSLNGMSVGGNWNNLGSFIANNGVVTFDASSTGKTVNVGSSSFATVAFNNALGGWTVAQNATATANWSLAAASQFIVSPNVTMTVQGQYVRSISGASTTWANATLYLNGTSQTINLSSDSGDIYGTLKLGNNTNVKMWNSSAATTTVPSSSSLYSMDHAGVNGSLYIWGAYVSTSTENWSYGTDFDGTSLAGAQRQVNVRLASSSSVSINNTNFNIVGSSTATTTIANQGTGNYSLSIASTTLSANYYQVRNINANGINISGSSTVSSIDYADLMLEANGSSIITLSAQALVNSGNKTFGHMSFATSSGISAGYNVYLSGNPSQAMVWDFSSSTGSLASDIYDFDPGDPRGYLVWSDSTWQPASTHWRWYYDQTAETPIVPIAIEDAAPSGIPTGNILKLRLTVKELAGIAAANVKMKMQYSTSPDFSSNVQDVGEIGSTTALWTYGEGIDLDNATITTKLLSDSIQLATHNKSGISTSSYAVASSSANEWEFTLFNNAAVSGTTYYFRAYSTQYRLGAVALNTGASFPSIVPGNVSLATIVSGVASGTLLNSVTTNVLSTPTNLSFGTLNLGTSYVGAHQLSVSINGEGGYELFVAERQDFATAKGAKMTSVVASNTNPVAWPTGQTPAAFGYHTSDATLSGSNPSRFMADNTYAKLETTMREVGYNANPASNDLINLIYRLEVTNQQSAGDYSTNIEYVVVPTY